MGAPSGMGAKSGFGSTSCFGSPPPSAPDVGSAAGPATEADTTLAERAERRRARRDSAMAGSRAGATRGSGAGIGGTGEGAVSGGSASDAVHAVCSSTCCFSRLRREDNSSVKAARALQPIETMMSHGILLINPTRSVAAASTTKPKVTRGPTFFPSRVFSAPNYLSGVCVLPILTVRGRSRSAAGASGGTIGCDGSIGSKRW